MSTPLAPLRSTPGFSPSQVPYLHGWELQRTLHAEVLANPQHPGHLILLEHEASYTAGRRTQPSDRPTDGTPVIDVDRGGLLTWHGPGQLVAYPIVRLADPTAVRDYVFRLEQAIIDTIAIHGVEATRVEGRAGVWVVRPGHQDLKLAAIGIHIEGGVTMHGLALNVCNDLEPYQRIVPCGITDAGVTTLSQLTGRHITPRELAAPLAKRLETLLAPALASHQPGAASTDHNQYERVQA